MRIPCIVLFALAAWLAPLSIAQNSEQEELPSAPSAARPQQRPPEEPSPPQARPKPGPAPRATPESKSSVAPVSAEDSKKPTESFSSETGVPAESNPARDADPKELESKKLEEKREVDESLPTIRRRVDEVSVVFTVTDKHGRYVKDLKKDDFRVIDDSRPAVEIRSFRSETDLPLQVGLLVDASNSVRDRFKFEQASAIEFLNQIVRPRYDKAFVVGFDVTPEVTADFTDDTEVLSRGVRALRAGGGTAMYDALYFACRDKLLKAARGGTVRRAVILLSDGEDNQSHVTREEAIEMAQRAEAIVYTISTNVSGTKSKGDKVLERIAEATGGRAFFPFQIREVSDDFAVIQDELRSQYALSYKPADFKFDGKYRTIEILAQNHKNLHVRSRHGYFAPVQ
jgi:Ca-activated chloride channel homolog